jgi:PadR family transcriptional regulator, regulatory protein PadR
VLPIIARRSTYYGQTLHLSPRSMTPARKSSQTQDELLKGTLDMLVLKTLTVQPMHGYAIVRHIERLSGGVFNIEHGSLYPALERLQKNGLVVGKWGESPTGRRARYYTLTAAGRRKLGEKMSSFDRVLAAIAGVMNGDA